MTLNSVVLPAPLPPTRAVILPSSTERLMPRSSSSVSLWASVKLSRMSFSCSIISFQRGFAQQALRTVVHDENQGQTVDDLAEVGGDAVRQANEPKQLGQQDDEYGSEDRPFGVADAADEEGAEDEDALVEGEACGVDVADVRGVDDACQTCHSCGEEEGLRLEHRGVPPHRLHGGLVGTDGVQRPAERRDYQMMEEEYDRCHQDEREAQVGIDAGQLVDAQQLDAGYAGDAIRTAGDICPII